MDSRTDFRRTNSLARLAASAALKACTAFSMMASPTLRLNSKYSLRTSPTRESTIPRTSVLPSLVLVCPSNSGSGTLTEITAVKPSRIFSPVRFLSASLSLLRLRAKLFIVRVRTVFKPSRWVPPSTVRILLAKPSRLSLKASIHHCKATSTVTLFFSAET